MQKVSHFLSSTTAPIPKNEEREQTILSRTQQPRSNSVAPQVFHREKVLMKRSWREAEAFCEEFGAHLASFAHIEEENFVNELLHSKFNW